jgi:hypothetical protein
MTWKIAMEYVKNKLFLNCKLRPYLSFLTKIVIYLHFGRLNYTRSLQPSKKRTASTSKNEIIKTFLFLW